MKWQGAGSRGGEGFFHQIRNGDTGSSEWAKNRAHFSPFGESGTRASLDFSLKIPVSPKFAERRILRRIPERIVFSELTRRIPESAKARLFRCPHLKTGLEKYQIRPDPHAEKRRA